jgi:hypothetical protein
MAESSGLRIRDVRTSPLAGEHRVNGSPDSRVLVAQFFWAVAVFVVWVASVFGLRVDPDYTSGELLDHVLAWTGGDPLYSNPASAPYRVLNYPPGVLAVVRAVMLGGVDAIVAGRLVGTIGILLALAAMYGWIRDRGADRALALGVTGLAAVSFPLLYAAGQFHIEGLALAATVAGFRLAERDGNRNAATAGLLLAAACFFKQTQVVPALIALAWIAVNHRERATPAITAFVGAGLAGCAVITAMFGQEAWRHMVTYTVGTYSLSNLGAQLVQHALPWAPMAAIGWMASRRDATTRGQLASWYLVGTTVWTFAAARDGSGFQYFLDWHVATLVCAAPWFMTHVSERRSPRVVGYVLAAYVFVADVAVASVLATNVVRGRATGRALEALCTSVPPTPSLTITESAGAVRACGGRPLAHAFIVTNLIRRGVWTEAQYLRDLRSGSYRVALLPFDPAQLRGVHRDRWTPTAIAVLRDEWRVVREARGWRVLEPRTP